MDKTNIDRLADLFGSKAALAEVCGVDAATVTRWNKPTSWRSGRHAGNGGRIPPRYNRRIRDYAAGLDFGMSKYDEMNACLDPNVCPTCGQAVEEGSVF
jgi:hypothetical protein